MLGHLPHGPGHAAWESREQQSLDREYETEGTKKISHVAARPIPATRHFVGGAGTAPAEDDGAATPAGSLK
jgi:hypothetical protein